MAQGREIFDQDEGGNIAELEVGKYDFVENAKRSQYLNICHEGS